MGFRLPLRLAASIWASSLLILPASAAFNLVRSYSGSTFFDGFDFRDVR